MKLFDTIAKRFGYAKAQRSLPFKGAVVDRLSSDWPTRILTADAALRTSLRLLRARSRDLERNNNVAKAFKKALVRNVLGSGGIKLQMKVKNPNGSSDKLANRLIEEAWKTYCEEKFCDYTRKQTWRGMEEMALTRVAFDGETLAEIQEDTPDNKFRVALKFHEPDLMDETFTEDRKTSQIIMSVETDARQRAIAYWLLGRHPGEDYTSFNRTNPVRSPISADKCMHLLMRERPTQTRGCPWLCAGMVDVRMLDGYKEAELVAARVSASKAGFITKQFPEGMAYPETEDGQRQMEVEPGVIEELPMGANFTPWDPSHPNQAFGDFIKAVLRSIAGGLGMSYTTLSSDLEGVNYSSIRAGLLEEREEWIQIQQWMISEFHRPFFRKWLTSAIAYGAINLPLSKIEKFRSADTWCGRRWAWVDPEKDIRASLMAVEGGLRSRRRIVAESDAGDFEDVLAEISEDNAMAKDAGVTMVGPSGPPLTLPGVMADGTPVDDNSDAPIAAETVQDTALNGAQVTSLQQIIQAVALGQLPAASALAMIEVAFPGVDKAKIKLMVAAAEKFTPEPIEKPAPVAKPSA